MPLPEGYLPREGDEVLIRARAKRDTGADGEGYFEIIGAEHHNIFLNMEYIEGIFRRKWSIGDLVVNGDIIPGHGRVVGISEDMVWVAWPSENTVHNTIRYYTIVSNNLEPYVSDDDAIKRRDVAANR